MVLTDKFLLTDLYQISMIYGYWKNGIHQQRAIFNLYFRKPPFNGAYAVCAGLETALQFLKDYRPSESDLEFLSTLTGYDDKPLFSKEFLDFLRTFELELDIEAIPEGEIVFPNQPLMKITGPLYQCQLVETALLTIINFQTLIATKASRIITVTGGDPVLEFGLRRAQGLDGGISATRAAYIGGCHATSNVLAGKLFGIPVRGTHAHSWVMTFPDELSAFRAYAEALPNNCTFLVDTYSTEQGILNAITVGKQLQQAGFPFYAIRLDSGDLLLLSKLARKLLDEAGFHQTQIVATNDLDEQSIATLKKNGASIGVWGVGTNLITANGQPALGGVYKLAAIYQNEKWHYRVKLSEDVIKISTPGNLSVFRVSNNNLNQFDFIQDTFTESNKQLVHPETGAFLETIPSNAQNLLVPVMQSGKRIYPELTLREIRKNHFEIRSKFDPALFKIENPQKYPVLIDENLFKLKKEAINQKHS